MLARQSKVLIGLDLGFSINWHSRRVNPVLLQAESCLCANSLERARRMTPTTTTHVQETLQSVYEKYKDVRDGEVASYIPELAKAKPDEFGISLATVDGQVFSVGDWRQEFTIQSVCTPFAFLMALEEFGRDAVLEKVCVEPSGDAFNSIELEPRTMRPFNPMVNAGAIAVASMIKRSSRDEGVRAYVKKMQLAAGRTLNLDHAVLASETATGNRNRAIAYLMLNYGIIDAAVDHALHQYFSQCSLLVNCQDLAMMAATLANKGINPVSRSRYSDWSTSKMCWR